MVLDHGSFLPSALRGHLAMSGNLGLALVVITGCKVANSIYLVEAKDTTKFSLMRGEAPHDKTLPSSKYE